MNTMAGRFEVDAKRELLIGCGNSREKKINGTWSPGGFANLTTLDFDAASNPDVVHDLDVLPYPFEDNTFNEIHAYEVLEHCGKQGDWKFFFAQFAEFWRILKPGGYFVATVPMWDSSWAWGDPGHTRVITRGSLVFLSQAGYGQIGQTPMTDYRAVWKCDLEEFAVMEKNETLGFILTAKK